MHAEFRFHGNILSERPFRRVESRRQSFASAFTQGGHHAGKKSPQKLRYLPEFRARFPLKTSQSHPFAPFLNHILDDAPSPPPWTGARRTGISLSCGNDVVQIFCDPILMPMFSYIISKSISPVGRFMVTKRTNPGCRALIRLDTEIRCRGEFQSYETRCCILAIPCNES